MDCKESCPSVSIPSSDEHREKKKRFTVSMSQEAYESNYSKCCCFRLRSFLPRNLPPLLCTCPGFTFEEAVFTKPSGCCNSNCPFVQIFACFPVPLESFMRLTRPLVRCVSVDMGLHTVSFVHTVKCCRLPKSLSPY